MKRGLRRMHLAVCIQDQPRNLLLRAKDWKGENLTEVTLELPAAQWTVHVMSRLGTGQYQANNGLLLEHGLTRLGEVHKHDSLSCMIQVCVCLCVGVVAQGTTSGDV